MPPTASPTGPRGAPRPGRALAVAFCFVALTVAGLSAVGRAPDHGAAARSDRPVAITTTTSAAAAGPGSAGPTSAAAAASTGVAGPTTTSGDGDLPQTDARPTTTSSAFVARAHALWDAIATDDPDLALGSFFPQAAYRQVKAVVNPDADYRDRLLSAFRADVHDFHRRLGAHPSDATFVGLDVPTSAAQWIRPGVEFNRGSYWRVYGSTIHYRMAGADRTLAVASLISWRGEWYVVHLASIR